MQTCTDAAAIRYPRTRPTWQMNRIQLAKVWAEHYGVHTHRNGGGWLYSAREKPYMQGWENLAADLERTGLIKVGTGINWQKGA